ncbi:hypothetical protein HPB52_021717 [Rhipicephalus sanguineus]|uniref:Uncharacterized protein n=1 Tax=Rhipicephalus sanguineus TaxID=34632 RepID=A0A9D4T4F7_RHISA|nr:hypothetical protein HPB52_021717 [Rhipicephalus sanguineus]
MAQPTTDEPLLGDLQPHTVLRSGRTLSRSAPSPTVASAFELNPAPVPTGSSEGFAVPQVAYSTALQMDATSVPRDAVHAPSDFTAPTTAQTPSASMPELLRLRRSYHISDASDTPAHGVSPFFNGGAKQCCQH